MHGGRQGRRPDAQVARETTGRHRLPRVQVGQHGRIVAGQPYAGRGRTRMTRVTGEVDLRIPLLHRSHIVITHASHSRNVPIVRQNEPTVGRPGPPDLAVGAQALERGKAVSLPTPAHARAPSDRRSSGRLVRANRQHSRILQGRRATPRIGRIPERSRQLTRRRPCRHATAGIRIRRAAFSARQAPRRVAQQAGV